MTTCEADELVAFERVRVVSSTATALHCAIGEKRVWLPREHIKGRLWSPGDCGTLLIRRWIALDRHLTVREVLPPPPSTCGGGSSLPVMRQLRLLPSGGRPLGN